MAYILDLNSYADHRGVLTVIDKTLPFELKRIFYITGVGASERRGGHRHYQTVEAVICLQGAFTCGIINESGKDEFLLSNAMQCLIVEPGDWHEFYNFEPDSILMGISSTHYDKSDYNDKPLSHDSVRGPQTA